uniref:Down syndrome cell adhesion molecule-like protein Dscam2 n=1 Tax=Mesocestoides corti TaxID=53468 RepID=A0A5K3EWA9_MESCO
MVIRHSRQHFRTPINFLFWILVILCDCLSVTVPQHVFKIPPSFTTLPPKEIIHSPGRSMRIPCSASGYPQPRIEWYITDEHIALHLSSMAGATRPENSQWLTEGKARIAESGHPHSWHQTTSYFTGRLRPGWLYCVAANAAGRAISSPSKVLFAQIDEPKACETQTLILREQSHLRINCSVPESIPPATVRWMQRHTDGQMEFIHENRTLAVDDDGNLLVAASGIANSTTLTLFCSASNSLLRTMRTGCENVLHVRLSTRFQKAAGPILMASSPPTQTRLLNETAEFRCLISSFPGTELRWYWKSANFESALELGQGEKSTNYKEVFPNDLRVELKNEGTLLIIPRVTFEHAGLYSCKTVNKPGVNSMIVSASFKLNVDSIPQFKVRPVDTTVAIGGSAELRCEPWETGGSKVNVSWLMNGQPISRYLDGVKKRRSGNDLLFRDLDMTDSAVFQCNISNRYGFQLTNAYINVWNSPPAILRGPSEETTVAEGQNVILHCQVVNIPSPRVYWTKEGSEAVSDDTGSDFGRRKLLTDGSLEITKATLADAGVYKCVVANRFGSSSASGRLVIRQATRVISGPLWIGTHPLQKTTGDGKITATVGVELSLSCRAVTDAMEVSNLQIKWRWLGLPKFGEYQDYGGSDVLTVYSDLPPDTLRGVQRMVGGNAVESSLTIPKALPSHSGTYQCLALSALDNDSQTVDVIIKGPPDPPASTTLDCTLTPKKRTTVLSWTPGCDNNAPLSDVQIEYVVGFYRPLGNGQPLATPSFTSHNTAAIFQALSTNLRRKEWRTMNHSLTVVHPHDGDVALVNLTRGLAVVPIHPDVAYQFRIRLVNSIGISLPGPTAPGPDEEKQKRCLLKPQPPNVRPEELHVYGNVPNTVTAVWKPIAPIHHNGPGLRYHLLIRCLNCDHGVYYNGLVNETVVSNWNQSRFVFTTIPVSDTLGQHQWPVEIFKQYTVSITTSNALGFSKAGSLISTGWSAEAPPSIAPHRLRAIRIGASSAELEWEWPTENSKGLNGFFVGLRIEWCLAEKQHMCDRYKVVEDLVLVDPPKELHPSLRTGPARSKSRSHYANSLLAGQTESQNPASTPGAFPQHRRAVLRDLPGLSHLHVWIRLLNIQYEGPSSEILHIHTKEGVPGAVGEFTHSFSGVDYVEVAWAKPLHTNGILTGYVIDVLPGTDEDDSKETGGNSQLYQTTISDPDQMAARISGLEINSSYKLVISALTAVGAGKSRELKVHTAKQILTKSSIEFGVSPIYGSTNLLNVSLVQSTDSLYRRSDENQHLAIQRDDTLTDVEQSSVSGTRIGFWAFLVQFKKLQDEHWEETEKELTKDWQIISNLVPGEEYDMRIVLATSSSISYVSPIRILRVPRPEEFGFGHYGDVHAILRDPSPFPAGDGASFSDLSFILKIFVPISIIILILALVLVAAFCLRGPFARGFSHGGMHLISNLTQATPTENSVLGETCEAFKGSRKGRSFRS